MAYVPCDAKGKEFTEKDDKFVENPDSLVGRDIDFKIKIVNARGLPNRFTVSILKGIDYCPVEIIKGLTDKGQFQYLTNLKGSQVGNYLYTTQFRSLR